MNFCCVQDGFGMWWILNTVQIKHLPLRVQVLTISYLEVPAISYLPATKCAEQLGVTDSPSCCEKQEVKLSILDSSTITILSGLCQRGAACRQTV